MKSILVVDDHSIVRYGTMHILQNLYSSVTVCIAKDVDEMVKYLLDQHFDLIILDINIPGGNNFQMLDIVKLRQPRVKILIFSGYEEQLYAHRYLASGAHGYLQKQAPEKELKDAIETIFRNEKYISPQLKVHYKQVHEKSKSQTSNPLASLSNRETEVMHLLTEGLSTLEISIRLNLHLSTVSTYKQRIFEKLNVTNLVDLIQKAKIYHQV